MDLTDQSFRRFDVVVSQSKWFVISIVIFCYLFLDQTQ